MKNKSEILIVFSSEFEAERLLNKLQQQSITLIDRNKFQFKNTEIEIFISGIGIPLTTYSLTKKISTKKYDLIINAGICGTFNDDLYIGDCVSVVLDEFADLGVSYPDNSFRTLFDEGLMNSNIKPFNNGKLYNPLKTNIDTELPKVTAITVNTVSGNAEQINFRREKFNPDVESMEGAAFAYVCRKENVNFLQIRAVSNRAEERNKENWDIPLALDNLADELLRIFEKFSLKQQEILIK